MWVRVPLSALILLGCSPFEITDENRFQECVYFNNPKCDDLGRWLKKHYEKCHFTISGKIYMLDRATMECWYKGRIIFTEKYNER